MNKLNHWSSRWLFVLAATGSAVGLGNLWKFPYVAGQNGGAVFVIIYLLCILFIGLPTLMAEVMIGRRGQANPVLSTAKVALESGHNKNWMAIGYLGLLSAFFLLSFYSVIAGWAAAFFYFTLSGFLNSPTSEISGYFDDLLANPLAVIFWQSLFLALTVIIISKGLKKGLEPWIKVLVPGLFIMLIILAIYSSNLQGFGEAMSFVFAPDWTLLTARTFLAAIGQAFFTLSIATASMLVYGSYLSRQANIPKATGAAALLDTFTALLAAVALFPLVFTFGLEPADRETLAFKILPLAFADMPYGQIIGAIFFLLLVFAALSSAISMVEPIVAWITQRFKWQRPIASWLTGFLIWNFGLLSALSFNVWSDVTILNFGNPFIWIASILDFILLPLGGLLIALFAGWVIKRNISQEELALPNKVFLIWLYCVRFLVPITVGIIIIVNFINLF